MAPVQLPNYNKWIKPPTAVYENNYGYGINFYQPMIDYIDAKERGVASKPPHLPWNNERGLEKFRFDKPVQTYSSEEIKRYSEEVAEQAKKDLNTFNIAKRSPFSVCATAAAANVTKHVGIESVTTKTKKKKVDREKIKFERQKKRMDEIHKDLELYEAEANVANELRGKAKMYRGKSAKAIAQTLLTESRKNVEEGNYFARNEFKENVLSRRNIKSNLSHSITQNIRTVREVSPVLCVVKIKSDGETVKVDDSYLQPLREIKETLKQFDYINTSFLMDKRWLILFI